MQTAATRPRFVLLGVVGWQVSALWLVLVVSVVLAQADSRHSWIRFVATLGAQRVGSRTVAE